VVLVVVVVAGPFFSELRDWLMTVARHDADPLCCRQAQVLLKATT
jgi:hypothetical protein